MYVTVKDIFDIILLVIMAKYDGICGQELMEVEEKGNEITLIFKDNRYLFVKVLDGRFLVDHEKYLEIKGKELVQVEEKEKELILIFTEGKFPIGVESGKLVTHVVPE